MRPTASSTGCAARLTAEGDFGPRTGFTDGYFYAYNTWVVIGAARLGQFDLAQKGMDFLMGFHDRKRRLLLRPCRAPAAHTAGPVGDQRLRSGGSLHRPPRRRPRRRGLDAADDGGAAELPGGAVHGHDPRRRAGDPRRPGRPAPLSPGPARGLRNAAEGDQYFFHPGIAGGFLARLYQATGEGRWLALARQYMRFAETATDNLYRLLRSGKVMWAASVLWTLTRESLYRDMALRAAGNIVAQQHAGGWWAMTGTEGTPSNDATAEMVVWLDEAYQALG